MNLAENDIKLLTFLCWGKTDPQYIRDSVTLQPIQPAICHMIDVGVVAQSLIETSRISLNINSQTPHFASWIAFIVALHDFGKLTPGFQRKCINPKSENSEFVKTVCQPLLTKIKDMGLIFATSKELEETDHGRSTFELLPKVLIERFNCSDEVADGLSRSIGGHHGEFHKKNPWQHQKDKGDSSWEMCRSMFIDLLLQTFELENQLFIFSDQNELEAAFLIKLAGLTAVADWIASDNTNFPYIGILTEPLDLKKYKLERINIANRVLNKLHISQSPFVKGESKFSDLFPFTPNETQRVANDLGYLQGNKGLLIIETPMGSGKTEAALSVADRWIRQGKAKGIYYALPTQATGNKMFSRVKKFLVKHPKLKDTELHLIHAFSDLQEQYEQIKITSIFAENSDASINAQEWFTRRKRGLLSPFAVGTIDQALLACLQVRHMFVRMFALSGKVVIIDEVHAYDTFTSEILDRLLTWLAALNSPVIILSATLPAKRRTALLEAYYGNDLNIVSSHYPCITGIDKNQNIRSNTIKIDNQKSFKLQRYIKDKNWITKLIEKLDDKLAIGGCAACILNTVDEAQALYRELQEFFKKVPNRPVLILFHARFPLIQRNYIEKEIDELFGPGELEQANGKRPEKAIVIGTQVLEQSLDVDFDWMLTDLAPIDLILQRSGRMHRHQKNNQNRPIHLQQPELYYLEPEINTKKPDFGVSAKIYEPAILLKTALVLKDREIIRLPDDLQQNSLIEQVYGSLPLDVPDHLTETLEDWWLQARWTERDESLVARTYLLPPPQIWSDGDELLQKLSAHSNDELIPAKAKSQTRLARPSIILITLHKQNGEIFLDPDLKQPFNLDSTLDNYKTRQLIECSISISNADWYGFFSKQEAPLNWQKSSVLRYCRLAVFENGTIENGGNKLKLSPVLGLIYEFPKRKMHDDS